MSNLTFKVYRRGLLQATESFDRDIIKIGRLSSAHLRLEDEKVSRIHAVVEVSASGDVNIIDMGSAEGTFVNGERVTKALLNPGDEIRLGDTRLVFQDDLVDSEDDSASVGVSEELDIEDAPTARGMDPVDMGAQSPEAQESYDAPDLGEPDDMSDDYAGQDTPEQDLDALREQNDSRQREDYYDSPDGRGSDIEYVDEQQGGFTEDEGYFTYRVALPPPKELGELDDDEAVKGANWTPEIW